MQNVNYPVSVHNREGREVGLQNRGDLIDLLKKESGIEIWKAVTDEFQNASFWEDHERESEDRYEEEQIEIEGEAAGIQEKRQEIFTELNKLANICELRPGFYSGKAEQEASHKEEEMTSSASDRVRKQQEIYYRQSQEELYPVPYHEEDGTLLAVANREELLRLIRRTAGDEIADVLEKELQYADYLVADARDDAIYEENSTRLAREELESEKKKLISLKKELKTCFEKIVHLQM